MKRNHLVVSALIGLAVVAAACGGGSSSSVGTTNKTKAKTSGTSAPTSTTAAAKTATIAIGNTKLGAVVVDATGMTLYELDHDTATMPTCTGACAALWPPVIMTTGAAPVAGTGLDAAKIGVVTAPTGMQVEYGGHPLYRFANDKAPGDVNGQGFAGGIWWVVGADGNKVTASASPQTAAPAPAPTTAPATTPRMTARPGY